MITCGHTSDATKGKRCEASTRLKEGESLAINLVLLGFLASLSEDATSQGCSHLHFPKLETTRPNKHKRFEPPTCEVCDDFKSPAQFRCLSCNSYFCCEHWEIVHRVSILKSHKRVAVSDDECPNHAKLVDRYCADPKCSKRGSLMCVQCEEISTHGHAGTLINDVVVNEKRKDLQRAVERLQSRVADKWVLWSKSYSALHDAMSALNSSDDRQFLSLYRDVHDTVESVTVECVRERDEIQRLRLQLAAETQLRQAAEAAALETVLERSTRAVTEVRQERYEAKLQANETEAEGRRRNDPRGFRVLVGSSAGSLNLNYRRIGDDEGWLIGDALKVNFSLTTLDLFRNEIGDIGCTAIGDALRINSTLTQLHLSWNQIGDAGCTAIGEALKSNSALTRLDLYNNRIGDGGCTALGDALKINSTLTTLHLYNNQIGDAGCTAVSDALKINSSLSSLDLSNNRISEAAYQLLRVKFGSRRGLLTVSALDREARFFG